jgi:hypothetical protein
VQRDRPEGPAEDPVNPSIPLRVPTRNRRAALTVDPMPRNPLSVLSHGGVRNSPRACPAPPGSGPPWVISP